MRGRKDRVRRVGSRREMRGIRKDRGGVQQVGQAGRSGQQGRAARGGCSSTRWNWRAGGGGEKQDKEKCGQKTVVEDVVLTESEVDMEEEEEKLQAHQLKRKGVKIENHFSDKEKQGRPYDRGGLQIKKDSAENQ